MIEKNKIIAPKIFYYLCFLVLILCIEPASAADYYVSTTGNNSLSGTTVETAWLNPSYATTQVTAGDTIYVMPGTYYDENMAFTNNGTEQNRIVVKSYSDRVTLDGMGPYLNGPAAFNFANKEYITVQNFKIYNYSTSVGTTNSNNITLMDSDISLSYGGMVNIGSNNARHNTAHNNTVHESGHNAITFGSTNINLPSRYITVTNNTIYGNLVHNGIDLFGYTDNAIIQNNTIRDQPNPAIYSHEYPSNAHRNVTIDSNIIYNVTDGMMLQTLYDSVISNNLIYDIPAGDNYGIFIYKYSENVTVINNNITTPSSPNYPLFTTRTNSNLIGNILNDYKLYRVTDSSTKASIIDALNPSYTVYSQNTFIDINYTDNSVFLLTSRSSTLNNDVTPIIYTPTQSEMSLLYLGGGSNVKIGIRKYNFTVTPNSENLQVTSVHENLNLDTYDITIKSSVSENPTWINIPVANTSSNYNITKDGAFLSVVNSGTDSIVRYYYNIAGNEWDTAHTFTIEETSGDSGEGPSIIEFFPDDPTPDQNKGSTYEFNVIVNEPLSLSEWYLDGDSIASDTLSLDYTWTHASTHNITFIGSNANGSVSKIWIVNVNDAPVLASIGAKLTNEGSTIEFTISATDPDSDPLTYSATNLPTGATFNPTTRAFSWTPDETQAGSYQVHFEVTDGSLSDAEDVTITVTGSSTAPSLISVLPSSVQVTPNTPFTLTIPIIPATPIAGAQFDLHFTNSLATVTSVTEGNLFNQNGATTLFSSGTINNAAGTVTSVYGSILGNTSVSSQGSLATISITAGSTTGYLNLDLSNVVISDADSNPATYTLTNATVLIDTAPVLTQTGAKSVDEGSALALTLSATDADGDSLTYSATNLPAGASFNTVSGAFSWTPADGQADTYVVTFEVTDGYISDSETVTITVNDANHAPVITTFVPANSLTYNEFDVITIGIVASDEDGDALSYTIKIDGVTKSTSSSYVWETDYSSAGTHTIDITVSDGIEQVTDQRIITINDVHPRWDVNEDGTVNVLDISIIGQKYGKSVGAPYPRWDVNQDGVINVQDMTLAAYYFGETVA